MQPTSLSVTSGAGAASPLEPAAPALTLAADARMLGGPQQSDEEGGSLVTSDRDRRQHQLHITVGTHPSKKGDLSVDLKLTKAAILYADSAELYSLTTSLLLAWDAIEDYDLGERATFLAKVMPFTSSSRDAKQFAKFIRQHKAELYNHPSKRHSEDPGRTSRTPRSSYTIVRGSRRYREPSLQVASSSIPSMASRTGNGRWSTSRISSL